MVKINRGDLRYAGMLQNVPPDIRQEWAREQEYKLQKLRSAISNCEKHLQLLVESENSTRLRKLVVDVSGSVHPV